MNRGDLRLLARQRLRDARILLRAGCAGGAYYLAGYSVECALKACVARKTRRYDFPDKDAVQESYTHNLAKLLRVAGLESDLAQQARVRPQFERNWGIVKDWKETSRYDVVTNVQMAQDLYKAITNRSHGVLPWIRQHW